MIYQNVFHESAKLSIGLRAALIDVIYKKSLTVSPSSVGAAGTGSIVNLMSVDLERLQLLLQFIWVIWFTPLNIFIATALLYLQLGLVCFVGFSVVFLVVIFNFFVGGAMKKFLVYIFLKIINFSK